MYDRTVRTYYPAETDSERGRHSRDRLLGVLVSSLVSVWKDLDYCTVSYRIQLLDVTSPVHSYK
jgi:hypothetical protein